MLQNWAVSVKLSSYQYFSGFALNVLWRLWGQATKNVRPVGKNWYLKGVWGPTPILINWSKKYFLIAKNTKLTKNPFWTLSAVLIAKTSSLLLKVILRYTVGANWLYTVGFLWSKVVETRGIFRYLRIDSTQKDYAQSKAYFLWIHFHP